MEDYIQPEEIYKFVPKPFINWLSLGTVSGGNYSDVAGGPARFYKVVTTMEDPMAPEDGIVFEIGSYSVSGQFQGGEHVFIPANLFENTGGYPTEGVLLDYDNGYQQFGFSYNSFMIQIDEASSAAYYFLARLLTELYQSVNGTWGPILSGHLNNINTKLSSTNTKLDSGLALIEGLRGAVADIKNQPTDACIIRIYVGDQTKKREAAAREIERLLGEGYRPYQTFGISEDLARVLFVKYPEPNDANPVEP